jgi:uncharacterized protein (TIGR03435 family)
MKKFLLFLLSLAAFGGTSLHAQDITGIWQGTLSTGGHDLRLVTKFSKDDAGGWKGTAYSIDQGGAPITLSKIVAKDGNVSYSIAQLGIEYAGQLSASGTTINGNWKQGDAPIPLVFTRVKPEAAWTIPEQPAELPAMDANANPSFEVATIKPTPPDAQCKYLSLRGRQFTTCNTSLTDLLSFAYGVHAKQLIGLPPWAATDRYDLAGQPDVPGAPNEKQTKSMVQKLIAERFKLTFHHDTRDLPVFAITVAKPGSKPAATLTPSQSGPNGNPGNFFRGLGTLVNVNSTIKDLARVLQAVVLDRPVVDQTGITGRYDFTLKWTPDETQFVGIGIKIPPPSDKPDAPPNLFSAMQEQLGLKLEPTKAPVDVLVIDHVEKPSDN